MKYKVILFIAIIFVNDWSSSYAQILGPINTTAQCRMTHLEAILLHHQGKQVMTLMTRFQWESLTQRDRTNRSRYTPTEELTLPDKFAWIVPLPPGFKLNRTVDASLFEELYDLTNPSSKSVYGLKTGGPKGLNRYKESLLSENPDRKEGLQVNWMVIEGTGEKSATGLNNWLAGNGLTTIDARLISSYVQKGWTYAIGEVNGIQEEGHLGPIQFIFDAPEIIFPLRNLGNTGTFDLNLYVLSSKELDTRSFSQVRININQTWTRTIPGSPNRGYVNIDALPLGSDKILEHIDNVRKYSLPMLPASGLLFYAFKAEQLNGYGRSLSQLREDPVLVELQTPTPSKSSRRSVGTPSRQIYRR